MLGHWPKFLVVLVLEWDDDCSGGWPVVRMWADEALLVTLALALGSGGVVKVPLKLTPHIRWSGCRRRWVCLCSGVVARLRGVGWLKYDNSGVRKMMEIQWSSLCFNTMVERLMCLVFVLRESFGWSFSVGLGCRGWPGGKELALLILC